MSEEYVVSHDQVRGPWVQGRSGRLFYLQDPRPEYVDVRDVAHALANLCRYTGHTRAFFSVAQHCVLVSRTCDPEHARDGLVHDAAEAYVADLSAPVKSLLPEYRALEHRVATAVAAHFGVTWPPPPCVRLADRRVFLAEARDLMGPPVALPYPGDPAPAELVVEPWSPTEAAVRFLQRYGELWDGRL